MKTKQKAAIKSKNQDVIGQDELDPRQGKFRVTMFLDLDLLDEIRKRAAKKRLPYQTFINQILRDLVFEEEIERIRSIVREEMNKKVS